VISIWPFRRGTFLLPEDEAWHFDTWRWLLEDCGGMDRLLAAPIVNATREFFPPTDGVGHARAEHIFACVKRLAGMADWPCTLVAQPTRPGTRVAELGVLKPTTGHLPLGTFSRSDGDVTITYDPDLLGEPAKLVATLAHELSHYMIANVRSRVPGGEEMHEYATDLGTVFLGFGLFGANRAFEFSQHHDSYSLGWKTSSMGYLRERDWVFALATFLSLRSEKPERLKGLLKPHLYAQLRKAHAYLAKNPAFLESHRRIAAPAIAAAG
jgi:hypothetical protein